MSEEKKEECGIVAIISKTGKDVAPLMYNALLALQHRGQDAAGFTVLGPDGLESRKGIGFVSEIFKPGDMEVKGSMAVGHTRYPTIGKCQMCDVQPTVIGNVALTHNGHIANYDVLKKDLEAKGKTLQSTVDSEPIAMLLEEKLDEGIEAAVGHVMEKLDGGFSDAAIVDGRMIVFRDPHSIRPLIWGENEDYIAFASESVALDINGIGYKGEVGAGELIVIDNKGKMERKVILQKDVHHCMFEYVYFSRPDSIINGKLVHEVRGELGRQLAKEHPVEADVIIPVPDTSRTAARTFALELDLPYEEGLIKNRYVARTFIMPNQEKRKQAVKVKLNPIKTVIKGKRIVLVDDSIVRGTTLREIVRMVKDAGAKEVHVRITSPPIRAPCFYGVEMSTYEELIANKKSIEEIAKYLGVESLGYLSIDGLKRAIDLPVCTGCLDEGYPTEYAKKLAAERKSISSCG
jgi:amidophosphoribosyltransferase